VNTVYVTDGSFEGLLSAVYDSWYVREDNVLNILPAMPAHPDFLITYKPVKTNEAKAAKVFDAVVGKISGDAARRVMLCWFSEQEDAGRIILNYLRLGFSVGPQVEEMTVHKHVKPMHDAAGRVGFEAHRMLGLARFYKTKQDWYCAVIEPLYYILPLVAGHFAERTADSRWMIHDRGRALTAAFENGEWSIVPGRLVDTAGMHRDEEMYQQMWRRYFDAMAIENRLNRNLQRHFMPKRYWKHLVEDPNGALNKAMKLMP
jgi:probable DNA metabolism protein